MPDPPRERRSAGVTMAPGAGRGKSITLLALAVCLGCAALLVLFGRPAPAPPSAARPPAAAAAPAASREARASAAPALPPSEARAEAAEPAPAEAPVPEQAPPPEDEEAEAEPAVPSGIGLFPPPGTDPIKVGIVVPDDYELPEGYLRHYQVTDDGQELEPILLFHPDYELLDAAGKPIPLPEDRVVPPELAPPGLPLRTLEVPAPRDEAGP